MTFAIEWSLSLFNLISTIATERSIWEQKHWRWSKTKSRNNNNNSNNNNYQTNLRMLLWVFDTIELYRLLINKKRRINSWPRSRLRKKTEREDSKKEKRNMREINELVRMEGRLKSKRLKIVLINRLFIIWPVFYANHIAPGNIRLWQSAIRKWIKWRPTISGQSGTPSK